MYWRFTPAVHSPAQCQGMMTFTELAPAASQFLSRSPTGSAWQ
jgi:hypothetical protein